MKSTERCYQGYPLLQVHMRLTLPVTIAKKQVLTAVLLFVIFVPAFAQREYSPDVNWLIEGLELEEGSVVADIGAGDGDQTLEVAQYVGSSGHVYSTELESGELQELREAVESADVDNVTVIQAHPARTNLPEQCCDALFLRRVYHHFDDPPSINASLLHSLKPGGRLAVIDFAPSGAESADPAGRSTGSHHGITAQTAIKELKQAGFILVSAEERGNRDVYIVVKKPEEN